MFLVRSSQSRVPHKAFLDFPQGTWATRRGDVVWSSGARHQPPQGRSWVLTPGHSPRGMASGGRPRNAASPRQWSQPVSSHFRKIVGLCGKAWAREHACSCPMPLGPPTTTHKHVCTQACTRTYARAEGKFPFKAREDLKHPHSCFDSAQLWTCGPG